MWDRVIGRLPSNLIIFSTVVSVLIPMAFYKLNQKFHDYGDPSWKKKQEP
ncbi:hypothetical protein HFZ78_19920 [Priestia megaterium]|uniref:Uncharacterized protein n=1 Tax=Priestia megaterium TaxID=1404 RepID=A0A6H1P552_PRIMG|nr:hypothetical protein [Priestia megaterium]QIZ08686.1 hypothetical protein HFZ78_19920 [Priestia megaterium]